MRTKTNSVSETPRAFSPRGATRSDLTHRPEKDIPQKIYARSQGIDTIWK